MKKATKIALDIMTTKWWLLAILLSCFTFALILFMGNMQHVWFDESYSIILAQQPFDKLLSLTGVDAHPPLYYLLLKIWGDIFGWSELALRSLSALLASIAVGVSALLVRRLFGVKTALVTLPVLVFAPFWLRYGYEIRMYALAGLICVTGTLVLAHALQRKDSRKWWAMYALFVALGMYTLYMTIVVWLAHAVWLLVQHRKGFWKQPWTWSIIGAIVLFLPYVPTAIFQLTHSALPGIGLRMNLDTLGGIASQMLIYKPDWELNGWGALLIVTAFFTMGYLFIKTRPLIPRQQKRYADLFIYLVFVPIVFFMLVSLPPLSPIFVNRYLAHMALFSYMAIGIVIALGWKYGYRKLATFLALIVVVMFSWGDTQLYVVGNYNYDRLEHSETTAVRQLVDCKTSTVVADDPYTYINDWYYFHDCNMKFYATSPVRYEGGYAWLASDTERISSSDDINSPVITHLYWKSLTPGFTPDSRYKLVSSITNDQQVTDTYQLNAE